METLLLLKPVEPNAVEEERLQKFKQLIEGYLQTKKLDASFCPKLIQYLENVQQDEKLLLDYLQGRKNSVDDAWNTLKSYVESRFLYYPDIFVGEQDKIPEKIRNIFRKCIYGMLRNPDKFGRKIVFLDASKWNINEFSADELATAILILTESLWRDPQILGKGVVIVQNSSGFGVAHAREISLAKIIRLRNLYKSFPISLKWVFHLNTHFTVALLTKMTKPFVPNKLRSRTIFYSWNQKPNELYDIASKEILADWMGGTLPIEEVAEDESFLTKHFR